MSVPFCQRLAAGAMLRPCRRLFSTTPTAWSQIGRTPVMIPQGVSIELLEINPPEDRMRRVKGHKEIEIKGPLGKLSVLYNSNRAGQARMRIYDYVTVEQDDAKTRVLVNVEDPVAKKQRAMWGTTRATLQNYVLGVSEGHSVILRLVGVGYRATVESKATTKEPDYPGQEFVNLKVGYSHPIELGVPEGVKATAPQPTRILLEGHDKEVVARFAASIRQWRVPEPYKGKGIFINDETIRLKAKKIK